MDTTTSIFLLRWALVLWEAAWRELRSPPTSNELTPSPTLPESTTSATCVVKSGSGHSSIESNALEKSDQKEKFEEENVSFSEYPVNNTNVQPTLPSRLSNTDQPIQAMDLNSQPTDPLSPI